MIYSAKCIGRALGLGLGSLSLVAGGMATWAQDKPDELVVVGTTTHRTVATEGKGGDITEGFQDQEGVGVTWISLETGPLHDRLFRELSLSETSIDVAFVLNARAVPALADLLEPLDAYMAKDPIEDWADVFESLKTGMVFDGTTYAIPFRHATSCFHYNARLFEEAGLEQPKTMEDVVAAARAIARPGEDIYGLVLEANSYPNMVDMARGWNGDFITTDFRVATTEAGMTEAITTLRDFFAAGIIPKNRATITDQDVQTWLQSGRAAMNISSCGRNQLYNAEGTQEAGNIKTIALPIAEALQGQFAVAPAKIEFWSLAIPRNSKNKDLAWRLIKNMLSKESTLKAALNGNGPVRASTYEVPEIQAMLPYAAAEKAVLLSGRVPLPAFDNSAQAADIFVEELQAAVLGMKPVDQALADVKTRVEPLLPKQ